MGYGAVERSLEKQTVSVERGQIVAETHLHLNSIMYLPVQQLPRPQIKITKER